MMKPFAVLVAALAAFLVVLAPVASAHEGGSCPSKTDAHGNSGQFDTCNVTGQHNGEGNTFNGMPVPTLPPLPLP